ncbi:helix-turn-helix transcriptional regulator [Volucribacter amazonae]|uniref:HTH cro/C1-type domain-containing protein n=1 Tax=Volucribacter amazonae TaxID=256731 RepID=A0A9X4SHP2_9PAST|nr:helix-turn-helix transcriptional regulator [Volucribacter amazonae]MDG6894720.1 hypothetical protein [Volucribacter amazonae]
MSNMLLEMIRKLRESKKITQAEMARSLYITEAAYGKLERGENNISLKRLNQIMQILLNIDFEKILISQFEVLDSPPPREYQFYIKKG